MFIVFDLDGTLALDEHRQHFLQRPKGEKDWDAYFEACDQDLPNTPVIAVMLDLHCRGHRVEIWSGRSAAVNDKTERWLQPYLRHHRIKRRMRATGDHTPDTELKARWLAECVQKPDLVFDDRDSVVAMWRDHGIVCCQVAPGDF